MVETIKAKEIMTHDFKWVADEETLSKALEMFDSSTHVLLVKDATGHYSGTLTERDILRSGLDSNKTKIHKLKSHAPVISPETPAPEIARLMIESNVMSLPVFDKDRLLGVVDDTRLLRSVSLKSYGKKPVKDFMSAEPKTASPKDTIAEVLSQFRELHVSRMPIVDSGKVVGIVTLHDIVSKAINKRDKPASGRLMKERDSVLDMAIDNIMSYPVISIPTQSTVSEAIDKMITSRINSVIVSDGSELSGVITRWDLIEPLSVKVKKDDSLININSKIEGLDREKIRSLVVKFSEKYDILMDNAFSVYLRQHKEKQKGKRLTYARIRVFTQKGRFDSTAENWGEELAVKSALLKLEKQLHRKIDFSDKKNRKSFIEYIDIQSLS